MAVCAMRMSYWAAPLHMKNLALEHCIRCSKNFTGYFGKQGLDLTAGLVLRFILSHANVALRAAAFDTIYIS